MSVGDILCLKKGLLFLLILIIASILFNVSSNDQQTSSVQEIVEIIENDETKEDGYINDNIVVNENSNVFVKIISGLSNLIKSLVSFFINLISKIISSFAEFYYLNT